MIHMAREYVPRRYDVRFNEDDEHAYTRGRGYCGNSCNEQTKEDLFNKDCWYYTRKPDRERLQRGIRSLSSGSHDVALALFMGKVQVNTFHLPYYEALSARKYNTEMEWLRRDHPGTYHILKSMNPKDVYAIFRHRVTKLDEHDKFTIMAITGTNL